MQMPAIDTMIVASRPAVLAALAQVLAAGRADQRSGGTARL